MLSISTANVAYHTHEARQGYYDSGTSERGRWFGAGAAALGLEGELQIKSFEALFSGFSPEGRKLVQNAGSKDRRAGWDLTFSAPKSVSVLWAIADESLRNDIASCHDEAVNFALSLAEEREGWARFGKLGRFLTRASLCVAIFRHGTTRAMDMLLHSHALVANVGVCEDGTTRALVSRGFYRWKMALGAAYRNHFAFLLQKRLGLEIVQTQHGFEIAGIPDRVLRGLSKRRVEIEAALKRAGYFSARASAFVTLITRRAKKHVPIDKLFEAWRRECTALGFSPDRVESLTHRPSPAPPNVADVQLGIGAVIDKLGQSQAHFTAREVIRECAHAMTGRGISSEELISTIDDRLEHSHDIIPLQELDGERHYTTERTQQIEAELLGRCDALHAEASHTVAERIIRWTLKRFPGVQSRLEQTEALKHLLSAGGLKLLSGLPGTGKTYVLDAARKAWERQGFRVVGAALAGRAARELESKSHIASDTIAKVLRDLDATPLDALKHHARQLARAASGRPTTPWKKVGLDANTVLVIDESGMIDTVFMNRLIRHAQAAGAKVILVGDPQQLPPIGAGGPFRALLGRFSHVHLKKIERQQNPRDIEAIHSLSRGEVRAAFRNYQERGLISTSKDRRQAISQLVSDWSNSGGIKSPDQHVILVPTNADRILLNAECQKRRMRERKLDPEAAATIRRQQTVEGRGQVWVREDIHVGDRVMCLQRWRALGLENGHTGTVIGSDREAKTLTIRFDHSPSRRAAVTIPFAKYPHLTLGYAATTHKYQGATVDHAYVLMGGGMQSREMTHTQISRAEHSTRIYVDEVEAGQNLERLISQVENSQPKRMAHELLNQNELTQRSDSGLRRALDDLVKSHPKLDHSHDHSLRPRLS